MNSERAATQGPVGLSNWDTKKSTAVSKVLLAGKKPNILCKSETGLKQLLGNVKDSSQRLTKYPLAWGYAAKSLFLIMNKVPQGKESLCVRKGNQPKVKLPGHRPGLPGHVVASRKRAKEMSF